MPSSISSKGRPSYNTWKTETTWQLASLLQFCQARRNANKIVFLLPDYKLRSVCMGKNHGSNPWWRGWAECSHLGQGPAIHLPGSRLSTAKERREARLFPRPRILESCQLALDSCSPSLPSPSEGRKLNMSLTSRVTLFQFSKCSLRTDCLQVSVLGTGDPVGRNT